MRFHSYLNEKYYNTIHQTFRNFDSDVFINPSHKELKDVIEDRGGMRFIIDFKKRKFYAFDVRMFHETVMNAVDELPNFKQYWDNGVGLDYIYTGNTYRSEVGSDAMIRFDGDEEFYPKIFKLRAQNWSWVDKYVSADRCIETIEMITGQQ